MTAFTSSQRDKVGIESLQDMTNFTPGMTYSSSLDHLYVRGEGRQSANLGADAGVATYVDGFYTPDPVIGIDPPMFSQNVEVLRGPQGTLSGRNGIGGALLITSTRPTSTPYAEARVTVENYGYTDVEGAVSGPLTDGLNARVAGWWRNQEFKAITRTSRGPTEGGVVDDYHLEVSTTARLGDDVDLFVRAFVFHTNDRGGPGARSGYSPSPLYDGEFDPNSSLYFNPAYAFGGAARNVITQTGVPGAPGALTQNPGIANPYNFMAETAGQFNTHDAANINYILTWHLDGVDLRYTGGYQQYTYTQKADPTPGNVGIQETDATSFLIPAAFNPTCLGGAATCLQVNPGGLAFHYQQQEACTATNWWPSPPAMVRPQMDRRGALLPRAVQQPDQSDGYGPVPALRADHSRGGRCRPESDLRPGQSELLLCRGEQGGVRPGRLSAQRRVSADRRPALHQRQQGRHGIQPYD